MIELKLGDAHLGLLPELGGAVAFWRLRGHELLVPTADPNLVAQCNMAVSGYPLVPFSNRIAEGHFSFEGVKYTLARNFGGESHAIHGNGWERAWEIVHHGEKRAVLLLDHDPSIGDYRGQWPFAYRASLSFVLRRDGLDVDVSLANLDSKSQPVGMGFHPFFARSNDMTIRFAARSMWENGPDMLPVRQVACTGDRSYDHDRVVGRIRLDNCFAGWGGAATLGYPSAGYDMIIRADTVFEHLVVFTAPDKPFVAVEAVTNMNDAVNHPELSGNGLHVLKPGERMSGGIRYKVVQRRG